MCRPRVLPILFRTRLLTPTFATERSGPNERRVDTAVQRYSDSPALTLAESAVRHYSGLPTCRRQRADALPLSSDVNRTVCRDFSALLAEGSPLRSEGRSQCCELQHKRYIPLYPTERPCCCHRCRRREKRKRVLCNSYLVRTPGPNRNDRCPRRAPRRPVHCSWICVKTLYVLAPWFTSLPDTDLKLQLSTRQSEPALKSLNLPLLVPQ